MESIRMILYIFEKELEIVRKIGAYIEQIKERWDFRSPSKLMEFLCVKDFTHN